MKFNESHEWVELIDAIGVVGVTNYAQKELGDIVYVELPKVGSHVKAGDQIAILESTKAAADVYSPVSGEIIEINHSLKEEPEKINNEAQSIDIKGGWLYKIKLSNLKEYEALMDQSTYISFIAF